MAINLPAATLVFLTALENITGIPIAVLDRNPNPSQFWEQSTRTLCAKTQGGICNSEDLRVMKANTEYMGSSHILEYKSGNSIKRICAIIPPMDGIIGSTIGEAYKTGLPDIYNTPAGGETTTWLMLYHAAHCLDSALSEQEENRATAFATLGLSLMTGDPTFLSGTIRAPARQIAVMTGKPAAYWAAGTGERILMDLWKKESADILSKQYNCLPNIKANGSIDIERIARANSIAPGQNCAMENTPTGRSITSTSSRGEITDENLWLWLNGPQYSGTSNPKLGAPPMPYTPFKSFKDFNTAASYILDTANKLAK